MADRHRCRYCRAPIVHRWGACLDCRAGLARVGSRSPTSWHRGATRDLTSAEREALIAIYTERVRLRLPLFSQTPGELLAHPATTG